MKKTTEFEARKLWIVFLALATVLLCGCSHNKSDDLLKLYQDIYGKDMIVYLPESRIYCQIDPRVYDERTGRLTLWQLTIDADEMNYYYVGEEYSCISDSSQYSIGDEISINVYNHSSNVVIGSPHFRLDYLENDMWYPLNKEFSFNTVAWSIGSEGVLSWKINEYTLVYPHYSFYEGAFHRVEEDTQRTVLLPAGHYRFTTHLQNESTGGTFFVSCEFNILR